MKVVSILFFRTKEIPVEIRRVYFFFGYLKDLCTCRVILSILGALVGLSTIYDYFFCQDESEYFPGVL